MLLNLAEFRAVLIPDEANPSLGPEALVRAETVSAFKSESLHSSVEPYKAVSSKRCVSWLSLTCSKNRAAVAVSNRWLAG